MSALLVCAASAFIVQLVEPVRTAIGWSACFSTRNLLCGMRPAGRMRSTTGTPAAFRLARFSLCASSLDPARSLPSTTARADAEPWSLACRRTSSPCGSFSS